VRFWDTSALLPLLIEEATRGRLVELLRRDPGIALWWGTPVECSSALARVHRDGALARSAMRQAHDRLDQLRASAFEVQPLAVVRARAVRLLAVHRLRAADSLQLAAALVWCRERPQKVGFVCLDERLRLAAGSEGFQVVPYSEDVHEDDLVD